VPALARAALAAGADGLFVETHPRPEKSPCDGPTMMPLAAMAPFLAACKRVFHAARAGA
jgi:2-dehydro-3-deoxyphosphooctonate aldolase (KDO 8-P synthase)